MKQMKVWAIRNGKEDFYNVDTPQEAFALINNMADADLKNDAIDFNAFDLLVFDGQDWAPWENSEGDAMDYLITTGEFVA